MGRQSYVEKRPWGKFEMFSLNELSTVKILTINSGEELSLQTHKNREEFWHVISGSGTIVIDSEELSITPDKNYFAPAGINHTIRAGDEEVVVLEVSFGKFDEDDIVRLKDKYSRTGE